MLRRDYILRSIDEFARAVAYALGLNKSNRTEEAVREIQEAFRTWFALDADLLSRISPEELLEKLQADEEFPLARIEALAMGLKADYEMRAASDSLKELRRTQALALLQYVDLKDTASFSFTRKTAIGELIAH
jgi:short-subunit dehydrogenase involved in D-alanine esterification of teichoic acids